MGQESEVFGGARPRSRPAVLPQLLYGGAGPGWAVALPQRVGRGGYWLGLRHFRLREHYDRTRAVLASRSNGQ